MLNNMSIFPKATYKISSQDNILITVAKYLLGEFLKVYPKLAGSYLFSLRPNSK